MSQSSNTQSLHCLHTAITAITSSLFPALNISANSNKTGVAKVSKSNCVRNIVNLTKTKVVLVQHTKRLHMFVIKSLTSILTSQFFFYKIYI